MLDSGGAYGRHWEQNQGRDFDSEPEVEICATWGLSVTLNVYHWLRQACEYAPELDQLFQDYVKEADPNDKMSWHQLAHEFVDDLGTKIELGGEMTTPDKPYFVVNTYNGEDALSQTIEYTYFEVESAPQYPHVREGAHILLQIHNGCDARGGYTMPRVFFLGDDYPYIYDNAHVSLYCPTCQDTFDSDNAGYNFSHYDCDTKEHFEIGGDRSTVAFLDADDDSTAAWLARWQYKLDGKVDYDKIEELLGERVMVALDEKQVLCPLCGQGILQGGF